MVWIIPWSPFSSHSFSLLLYLFSLWLIPTISLFRYIRRSTSCVWSSLLQQKQKDFVLNKLLVRTLHPLPIWFKASSIFLKSVICPFICAYVCVVTFLVGCVSTIDSHYPTCPLITVIVSIFSLYIFLCCLQLNLLWYLTSQWHPTLHHPIFPYLTFPYSYLLRFLTFPLPNC